MIMHTFNVILEVVHFKPNVSLHTNAIILLHSFHIKNEGSEEMNNERPLDS